MSDIQLPNIDYAGLSPLLIVLGVACLGILVEAIAPRRHRYIIQVPLTLGALVAGLVAVIANVGRKAQPVFTTNDGARVDAVITDGPGLFLSGTILVLGIIATLLIAERRVAVGGAFVAHAAVSADSKADSHQVREPGASEVFPLTLFAIGGMILFCTAGDLLTLFVALEVFSLPLYLLCGLARRRRLLSQEAAMKYFLLGAFASAFFVYGVALLYGYAESVQLADINTAVLNSDNAEVLLLAGLAMLTVGLLFKAAAVPFHVWTPDVYTGAPTPVTALMAACTKVAAFGGMLRVFNVAFGNGGDPNRTSLQWEWEPLLTAVAIATMIIGAILAVTQTDIKRLLAYSSIANAGYLLVGVIALDQAIGATMFYLAAYGFTVLAAFAVVTLVRDADGEATHLSRWAGLAKRSPRFAVIFTLIMLAFAGIPLTSGFAAKFAVFSSALEAGQTTLVIVGVLSSVILAFPYLKVVVLLWLNEPVEDAPAVSIPSLATGTAVGIGVVATIALGLVPQPLLDVVNNAGTFLAK